MKEIADFVSNQLSNIYLLFLIASCIIHILFAGAVAKDAGFMRQKGRHTVLVSGLTWAFATFVGGVFVAVVYWFIHHATFIHRK